ncbi:MAG: EAL domain-containing protein, partial [Tumebacillaceae bacterium]
PALKIGVNLSARQFMHDKLVDTVAQVLQETDLDPQFLDLEITESIAMQDGDFVIKKLQELSRLGIQISIDDFGTGYSSLSYIKKFPINTLKIAQPFVSDITESPGDAAIVSAIIAMAHGLNMNVIAEGVETDYQRAFLRKLRCDKMQGFLYSKPLSADTFTQLLKNRAKPVGYQLSHSLSP